MARWVLYRREVVQLAGISSSRPGRSVDFALIKLGRPWRSRHFALGGHDSVLVPPAALGQGDNKASLGILVTLTEERLVALDSVHEVG
jgi:hypothetical protein